jgi:hypothetical protein
VIPAFFEYPSFSQTSYLRNQARNLNSRISTHLHLSKVRPSKQSRAEQLSRAACLTRQRDSLLDLYPEYFL